MSRPFGWLVVVDERIDFDEGVRGEVLAHIDPESADLPQVGVLRGCVAHEVMMFVKRTCRDPRSLCRRRIPLLRANVPAEQLPRRLRSLLQK